MKVTAESWPIWSRNVAYPADPAEYVEAAVERLMKELDRYVVDVKNVRPQFNAINSIRMIDFETAAEREFYVKAFERYLENTARIEREGGSNSKFMMLVEWLKFRQAAELVRAAYQARQMFHATAEGFAVVGAMCFKPSMAKVVHILHTNYGVPRSKISMIWGGSQAFVGRAEKRIDNATIQQVLVDTMQGKAVDSKLMKVIKQQLLLDAEGIGDLPKELDLGPQDFVKRQEEIDRFQAGTSDYCLFNFKSGGVGLSLHHTDELTQAKVRRKPHNGYANVDDIPLIPTKPRLTFLTPTFSAIELVQGLGRAARITSLSDTKQIMLFYKGTIEVKVAAIVSSKLRCLKKVVRQRESWEDVILQSSSREPAPVVPDEENISGNDLFDLEDGGEEEEGDDKE